ncbi:hypothetical protein K8I61_14490 [bacterium]|nr:hypothetical protein [bacterium]
MFSENNDDSTDGSPSNAVDGAGRSDPKETHRTDLRLKPDIVDSTSVQIDGLAWNAEDRDPLGERRRGIFTNNRCLSPIFGDPPRKFTYANFNIVNIDVGNVDRQRRGEQLARQWSDALRDDPYYRTLIWETYDVDRREDRRHRYDGFGITFGRSLPERQE